MWTIKIVRTPECELTELVTVATEIDRDYWIREVEKAGVYAWVVVKR